MGAENAAGGGCPQRNNAEHEGYAGARRSFRRTWKERDSAQPELLEKILEKDNLNRAFKRVKANRGAPGIDGMTIEEALPVIRQIKSCPENHIKNASGKSFSGRRSNYLERKQRFIFC